MNSVGPFMHQHSMNIPGCVTSHDSVYVSYSFYINTKIEALIFPFFQLKHKLTKKSLMESSNNSFQWLYGFYPRFISSIIIRNFTHASIDNDDGKDTREYLLKIFNLHHFEQSDSDDDTN